MTNKRRNRSEKIMLLTWTINWRVRRRLSVMLSAADVIPAFVLKMMKNTQQQKPEQIKGQEIILFIVQQRYHIKYGDLDQSLYW